jgi:hypothetical protein
MVPETVGILRTIMGQVGRCGGAYHTLVLGSGVSSRRLAMRQGVEQGQSRGCRDQILDREEGRGRICCSTQQACFLPQIPRRSG